MKKYLVGSMMILGLAFLGSPTAAAAQSQGCGKWDYTDCTDDEHDVEAASADFYTNPHSDCRLCVSGPCGHEVCGLQEDVVPDLLAAIDGDDAGAISMIMLANPKTVQFNAARQAIQIVSCAGAVVGHFPVPDQYSSQLVVKQFAIDWAEWTVTSK